jgi:hypothetical protein
MKGRLANYELERMWKKADVAQCKVLLRYLPGGTEENHENLSQDNRSPGRDLGPGTPEYEAGVLTTLPRRTVPEVCLKKRNMGTFRQHMREVLKSVFC